VSDKVSEKVSDKVNDEVSDEVKGATGLRLNSPAFPCWSPDQQRLKGATK